MKNILVLKENEDGSFSEETLKNKYADSKSVYAFLNANMGKKEEQVYSAGHIELEEFLSLYYTLKHHYKISVDFGTRGNDPECFIFDLTNVHRQLNPKIIFRQDKKTHFRPQTNNLIHVNFRKEV